MTPYFELRTWLEAEGFTFHYSADAGHWWVLGRPSWSSYETGEYWQDLKTCLAEAVNHLVRTRLIHFAEDHAA